MNSEVRDWFIELEPPPGGAERFAARLDAETAAEHTAAPAARPRRRLEAAAAACAAAALLVAIVWLREPNDRAAPAAAAGSPTVEIYNAPEFDRLLGRPLRTAELTVMLGAETLPATELATANEKIRIYRIEEPASPSTPP